VNGRSDLPYSDAKLLKFSSKRRFPLLAMCRKDGDAVRGGSLRAVFTFGNFKSFHFFGPGEDESFSETVSDIFRTLDRSNDFFLLSSRSSSTRSNTNKEEIRDEVVARLVQSCRFKDKSSVHQCVRPCLRFFAALVSLAWDRRKYVTEFLEMSVGRGMKRGVFYFEIV